MALEIIWPPPPSFGDRSLSYRMCQLFTYSNGYCEVYWIIRKKGVLYTWGELPWGYFLVLRKISRGELSRGNCILGAWQNSCIKFFLFALLSICKLNFVCVDVPGNWYGKLSVFLDFWEIISKEGGFPKGSKNG